ILEDTPGARDFTDAFRERLAFLARQQPAELLLASEDRRADTIEDVAAHLGAGIGPRGVCRLRGGDSGVDRAAIVIRRARDDVTGIGRIQALEGALARGPLAVDVMGECRGLGHEARPPESRPRPARFCMSSVIPKVQGGARSQVVTLFSSTPKRSDETRTTSFTLWVKPRPLAPRSCTGANSVP